MSLTVSTVVLLCCSFSCIDLARLSTPNVDRKHSQRLHSEYSVVVVDAVHSCTVVGVEKLLLVVRRLNRGTFSPSALITEDLLSAHSHRAKILRSPEPPFGQVNHYSSVMYCTVLYKCLGLRYHSCCQFWTVLFNCSITAHPCAEAVLHLGRRQLLLLLLLF
jgi:hypothetical protein